VLRKISQIIFLLVVLFGVGLFFSPPKISPKTQEIESDCITKIEQREVRGDSMEGLIEPQSTVTLLRGFYECNPVARGDIVAYQYSSERDPIVKKVYGVPGDTFGLVRKDESSWYIVINGRRAETSQNKEFLLDNSQYKMLALYEREDKGRIPDGAYMLLGNHAGGTFDSTRFGLVGRADILAKVVFTKGLPL
jgi:signal peptidase I